MRLHNNRNKDLPNNSRLRGSNIMHLCNSNNPSKNLHNNSRLRINSTVRLRNSNHHKNLHSHKIMYLLPISSNINLHHSNARNKNPLNLKSHNSYNSLNRCSRKGGNSSLIF
jgi:hypothetical protein